MRTLGRCLGRLAFGWVLSSFLITALVPFPAWATPMVAITQPTNGATVAAEVWVDAVYQSSSDVPIVRLELLVDDAVVHKYVLPTPQKKGQQSFSYKFRTEAGQLHKLAVRAIDATGAVGEASLHVTVKKALAPQGPDRTPPVVNIYYPHDGQQVAGTCEVKVDAQDNTGVEWVFVYLDGKIKAMIKGNPPYVDRWDTTKVSDGRHTIQAKAWDPAENQGDSAPVEVVVANRHRTTLEATRPLPPEAPAAPAAPRTAPTTAFSAGPGTQSASTPGDAAREELVLPTPVPQPASATTAPSQPPTPPAAPSKTTAVTAERSGVAPAQASAPAAVSARPEEHHIAMAPPPASSSRPVALKRPSVGRATGWAMQASSAPLTAALPTGGFGAVLTGQPDRVLVLHEQYVGTRADEALAPVAAAAASQHPVAPAAQPKSIEGLRLATPLTGATTIVRFIAPPALQAAPPQARATATSVRPGYRACPGAPARQSLPPRPPATGGSQPTLTAGACGPAAAGSIAAAPSAGPAATRPSARTAMLARPRPTPGSRPTPATTTQVDLADTASEVYLLAMLPGTSSPVAGARSTRPDGKFARTPQVAVVPSALARFRNVQVLYDGRLVPLRSCPEVTKGIPVGPLREIFEQCDGVLYWFPVTKRVKAVSPDTQVDLQIGRQQAQVNGDPVQLELAPYIKRGRTMVPLSFLAATLNLTITFDSHRGQLIISCTDM